MFYLIELSPTGKHVIGEFSNEKEASEAMLKAYPIGMSFCDYVIAKVL